jgi:hypothetical protein
VTANNAKCVTVFRGEGAGAFAAGQHYTAAEGAPSSVAVADMDGDGAPDLARPQPALRHSRASGRVRSDRSRPRPRRTRPPTLAGVASWGRHSDSVTLPTRRRSLPPVRLAAVAAQPFKGGLLVPPPLRCYRCRRPGGTTADFTARRRPDRHRGLLRWRSTTRRAGDVALSNALKGMAG